MIFETLKLLYLQDGLAFVELICHLLLGVTLSKQVIS